MGKLKILHLSTECYPAAKTGGLGDVVGALPKYQNRIGHVAEVVIPKYGISWINQAETEVLFEGKILLGIETHYYKIERYLGDLEFNLLFGSIPSLYDRDGIYEDQYGFFGDEFKRWIAFITSVLDWITISNQEYDVFHCHDHHMGLVPFFIQHCPAYDRLKHVPTVFTIHNGRYQGIYSWKEFYLLPYFNPGAGGLIEWNNQINCLAAGIKNCGKFTTVSPSYLNELRYNSDGLEWLFNNEAYKAVGILNGIDNEQWNPQNDPRIDYHLKKSLSHFKKNNKSVLLYELNSSNANPIVAFIGRLVHEKGVDFLIDLINNYLVYNSERSFHFVILGTGDQALESALYYLQSRFPNHVSVVLKYDETLAHKIYAGADYLIMPSRVEPCGLNQFYALRYGTIPIVRRIGGLNDSIKDFGDNGNGICFDNLSLHDGMHALNRAYDLFRDRKQFNQIRNNIIEEDNSWDASAEKYLTIYHSLVGKDEEE